MNSCQPPSGTPRSDARFAPSWEDNDSDVALRKGLGYLNARDGFDDRGLSATSNALVDRPANDPPPNSPVRPREDFGATTILTRL